MIKIYGPYKRKDNRSHIVLYDTITKKKTSKSYPRYLLEQKLGRESTSLEHVDHINNDPSDNRIENLQILTQLENNIKAIKASGREAKQTEYVCPTCGNTFMIRDSVVRHNQEVLGCSGPFCSRRCAGIMNYLSKKGL